MQWGFLKSNIPASVEAALKQHMDIENVKKCKKQQLFGRNLDSTAFLKSWLQL